MKPIILFFEDHRDPCAKKILSVHLDDLHTLNVNTLALEIDKGTSLAKYINTTREFCWLWSSADKMPSAEKKKMLKSLSEERQREFEHHISCLPGRKAELELLFRVNQMGASIQFHGVDLEIQEVRDSTPQQQAEIIMALQKEREKSMVDNLSALSQENGVIAILGLSHFEVANQLKQKGHEVFCFLPIGVTLLDGIRKDFLNEIEQHAELVEELTVLDERTHSISELWEMIESQVQGNMRSHSPKC